MRSLKDRIRHTVLFETFAVIIAVTVSSLLINKPTGDISLIAILLSIIAMLWNLIFNYYFDKSLLSKFGSVNKTKKLRLINSIIFELGLIVLTIPLLAWAFELTLLQAFIADLAVILFFLFYSYIFNWIYDLIYPTTNAIYKKARH